MTLPEICVKRPVFTLVLNILLVILGWAAFNHLVVRELPETESSIASITTTYPGASAALIENQVTTVIERPLAGVEGIDMMTASSTEGQSRITVYFKPGFDSNEGVNDIRDRIARISRNLPADINSPVVRKSDPNRSPVLFIQFTDPSRTDESLTTFIERYVQAELEQVEGVGFARIFGSEYALNISLDPLRMAAHQVGVGDIRSALVENNDNALPGGRLQSIHRDYSLNQVRKLRNADEFNQIILRDENGAFVRLEDVAHVSVGPKDVESEVRVNGTPAVMLAIIAQPTANPVTLSQDIRQVIDRISQTLPEHMQVEIVRDNAEFVQASIHAVYATLAEAVVLVILVVFLFLGSMRAALIPIVTIPVCIICSFALIYVLGMTLNNMTLLALVLAIGLVVDDAIVMLENIHRHIEQGAAPLQAALSGSREIIFPIIVMTLTLAAVYAPLGFAQGLTGLLFREFAFTLAGAVIISGFVALTLSPMMGAYLLPAVSPSTGYLKVLKTGLASLARGYQYALTQCLRFRKTLVLLALGVVLCTLYLFFDLPRELTPMEDRGLVRIFVNVPTGSNFAYLERQAKAVEQQIKHIPEVTSTINIVGQRPGQAMLILTLADWKARDRSQQDIISDLQARMTSITGARISVVSVPSIRGIGGNQAIELVIQVNGSYTELYRITENVMQQLEHHPGLTQLDMDLNLDNETYALIYNRALAANVHLDMNDVMDTVYTLFSGANVTEFEQGGETYDVLVQMPESIRRLPQHIDNVYVPNQYREMIPLSTVVSLVPEVTAYNLPHFNRLRAATLTASLNEGYALEATLRDIESILNQTLPSVAQATWAGQTRDFLNAERSMLIIVLFALLFIYLVLSAQFESFIDPLIIMLTVPFSIFGALVLLHISGGSNNIYSQIGFVTLIGLITKHGILITEFANMLQAQGKTKMEAIVQAAVIRLRPILMTTGAMVLGAVPLALASGPGAESRQQIGMVIVGGMLLGTFFSLFMVPLAYSYLSHKRKAVVTQPVLCEQNSLIQATSDKTM